jgi:molybdopterin-guanine dinucleotide biosynthesis protein A
LARDEGGDHQGPLAGVLAALPLCRHDLVLVVPCDSPFLPDDLVRRLQDAMTDTAGIVVAHDGDRLQPLFMLMHRSRAVSLRRWLAEGKRKVEDWCVAEGAAIARFDDAAAFRNLNTAQDLALAEKNGGNGSSRAPE